LTSPPIFHPGD